jgi:ribosomal protein L35AE/L33A
MKKIGYLGIILSVLMLFACGKVSVEDAAKNYVKKQCAFDNNVRVDTSKLKYSVVKKEGNRAVVRVSGTINFDGQLFLVKKGNQWKIGKKEDVTAASQQTTPQGQQKEAVLQTAPAASHEQAAHK